MNCKRCLERLSDYLDGTLGARHSAHVRAHLGACRGCQKEYIALQQVRTWLGALPAPRPRRDFWPHLYATWAQHAPSAETPNDRCRHRNRVDTRQGGRSSARRLSPVAARAAVAGGAALLVVSLALPVRLRHVHRMAPPTAPAIKAISADALVAIHTSSGANLPLSDSGRMRYLDSEADQADLEQDGILDLH